MDAHNMMKPFIRTSVIIKERRIHEREKEIMIVSEQDRFPSVVII